MVEKGDDNQNWFMDSGCSRHMTRRVNYVLSLKALRGKVCLLKIVKRAISKVLERLGSHLIM